MTITPVEGGDLSALQIPHLDPRPRSPGVHVSGLIKRLARAVDPERFTGAFDPVRMEFGFRIEAVIEACWASERSVAGQVFRPGEVELDGIVGSPDGIARLGDGRLRVEEIKCTWMSSRGCPEDTKFWHWIVQMKAYCHMTAIDISRLHVFFVNGDYREKREPQFLQWDFAFHQGELEENWMMLLRAKEAGHGYEATP